jgi:hypothetical protein
LTPDDALALPKRPGAWIRTGFHLARALLSERTDAELIQRFQTQRRKTMSTKVTICVFITAVALSIPLGAQARSPRARLGAIMQQRGRHLGVRAIRTFTVNRRQARGFAQTKHGPLTGRATAHRVRAGGRDRTIYTATLRLNGAQLARRGIDPSLSLGESVYRQLRTSHPSLERSRVKVSKVLPNVATVNLGGSVYMVRETRVRTSKGKQLVQQRWSLNGAPLSDKYE